MSLRKNLLLAGMAVVAFPALSSAVTINEIRIDNGGGDTDEFFELAGQPGESLDGLYYLVIGDSGTLGSGVVDGNMATDLTGMVIQADGLLSVHHDATPGTATCGSYDVEADMQFENSDNVTHMLVRGYNSAIEDTDTNDDGTIDNPAWTEIVDWVSLIETTDVPASGEYYYSPNVVGPDGSFVPAHAYQCNGTWEIGGFTICANDTPGEPNCAVVPNEETSFGGVKSNFE